MKLDRLTKAVNLWAENRGLHESDPSKQLLKVLEEVGEVAAAHVRGDKKALEDGIGDTMVTLIIYARQNNLDIADCLETAYNEIKGRKGKMVNGVFVKESDLVD